MPMQPGRGGGPRRWVCCAIMEAGMDGDPGELYTVEQAARVLDRTPGRVRQLLRSGDLEGEHENGDPRAPWRAYAWSVHAYRDRRPETAATRPRAGREGVRDAAEMLARVEGLQRELGRLEGRLELTARAESTVREDLERERARAEEERRRADAERERADDLRRELEAERSRGFWRRLFGGSGTHENSRPDQ